MKERNGREHSGVMDQREHESNVLVTRNMAQRRNETRAGARGSWGEASLSKSYKMWKQKKRIMGWGKRESSLLAARAARNERTELARLEWEG